MLRNWSFNRGAQVAPRPFVPVPGALPRPFEGPGWSWQPQPVHAEFVERFLALADDRRIPVYWIIPPAEAAWLERNERVGTVGAYRQYVRGLVARFPRLTVIDLQQAGWGRAMFRDPIHLNRDGAVRLTLAVADAIARARGVRDVAGRWITTGRKRRGGTSAVPGAAGRPRPVALAVSQGEHGPITMEGPRR